jgi:hypothetical protein
LEKPAVGVLQKIPMATDCMVAFLCCASAALPTVHR